MDNRDVAAIIAGIFFVIGGLVLVVASFFVWPIIFYAVICLGIGVAILFHSRKAEQIEQIRWKDIKGKRSKE